MRANGLLIAFFILTRFSMLSSGMANESTPWIWGPRDASEFSAKLSFKLPAEPETAQLKCAVDFCTAEFHLNGQSTCNIFGQDALREIQVTRFLRKGRNSIRISSKRTDGPAAVVFELKIIMRNGENLFVRSTDVLQQSSANDAKTPVCSYGAVSSEPWWHIKRKPHVSVFDEYNQWEESHSSSSEKEIASFQLPRGFEIDLVYTAQKHEGSWVSMAIDDEDRILIGKERTGILRLTLPDREFEQPEIETVNDTLKGVQGLLLTSAGLIASANRSEGLYRLSEDSSNPFGKVTRLQKTNGSQGDHGRHDVWQDAQGKLFVIHGDSIRIPDRFTSLVPATHEFYNKKPEDGHVIQTDVNGNEWKVFCSGLRNPYGLAANKSGELFTYDADAERHTGLPWYRPTRIVHLMPGVDYGWRNPENPWPGYLPDLMPPIVKIGRGSPTSLKFGYASNFPTDYRQVLFALDWSYGRILAIHIVPQGSTYFAHAEVFARGRPFSVCDLDFASDGSMYVITGGRDTISRLYRIRYVGPKYDQPAPSQQVQDRIQFSKQRRQLRRRLEDLFEQPGKSNIALAWEYLDHPDLGIRSAARILLEHQPSDSWKEQLWQESRPAHAIPALLALVRTASPETFEKAHRKLHSLPLADCSDHQVLTAIRIESLIDRQNFSLVGRSSLICQSFEPLFPSHRRSINRELCELLIQHKSTNVVAPSLSILSSETNQLDKFHFLLALAEASTGWNSNLRTEYFRLLSGARFFITDEGLQERLQEVFDTAITDVSESERQRYREIFAADSTDSTAHEPMPFLQTWTVPEIQRQLKLLKTLPNADNGQEVFRMAQCHRCHRFSTMGRSFGPDLTTVASRFSRKHILQQIVRPSEIISSQHQNHIIALKNGKIVTGQVVYNGFRKSLLRIATDPMALHKTTEIHKDQIESVTESKVSPMPERMLDILTIQQIADLLAFIESRSK